MRLLGYGLTIFVIFSLAAITGCSQPESPPAGADSSSNLAAADKQANKSLAMYRELLRSQSYELAWPIGQEIVQKFPATAAASEIQQTLADTENKARASSEKRRLEGLWAYQSGTESGGTQNTASIYSSEPSTDANRIRLVLRRHSNWGQSVYLFASGKGFECGKNCTLMMHFDDQPPRRVKASLPVTGEPAIFIEDDRAFIGALKKTRLITIEVALKARGEKAVRFEVGGFNADKFPMK